MRCFIQRLDVWIQPLEDGKGDLMKYLQKRAAIPVVLGCLTGVLIVASVAALCLGSQPYSLGQMWQALKVQDPQDPVWRVMAYVRLPRMLGGLFSGAALAVAGVSGIE
ncbi:iron chelate uptake ABC transporter family permease subunit [uncultured Subdoligranulum sp.]|uniref:iron chelate uptake ABC transporter family permease subunit n=1 Tax=uncultured Subdoligranulum sp. TaxID=512298 RepID=UPI00344B5FA8